MLPGETASPKTLVFPTKDGMGRHALMSGVDKPSHAHTCDRCHGEFPCREKDCPIAERFVCDECADDTLDETGSTATR